ncbi:MAG: cyclase family protein [Acidobacteria bacterium]|nr:cyclase family protein [Acidobacteriota bacterium]
MNSPRNRFHARLLFLIVLCGLWCHPSSFSETKRPLTKTDVDQLMSELSNWGRWGKNDQLGTMNLITPEKRRRATRLVREGFSVSLARSVDKETAVDNPSPFVHKMIFPPPVNSSTRFFGDTYTVSYHGHGNTHIDALCHMSFQGKMFNGFPNDRITEKGAQSLAIDGLRNGVLTRGLLIDIPQSRGLAYLEPDAAIYSEDLEAWEKKTGLRVGSGDVVLLRTGRWARRAAKGPWDATTHAAGLHASCVAWLKERGIALLGSDNASDLLPSGIEGVSHPVHQLLIIAAGVHILDNADLEALSKAASGRKRWEFLFVLSPLVVQGGTGSPVNPLAIF